MLDRGAKAEHMINCGGDEIDDEEKKQYTEQGGVNNVMFSLIYSAPLTTQEMYMYAKPASTV
jgi:hypothetical protein